MDTNQPVIHHILYTALVYDMDVVCKQAGKVGNLQDFYGTVQGLFGNSSPSLATPQCLAHAFSFFLSLLF